MIYVLVAIELLPWSSCLSGFCFLPGLVLDLLGLNFLLSLVGLIMAL